MANKERITVKLDRDVLARVRELVMHRRGTPVEVTVAGFLEESATRLFTSELRGERRRRGDPEWRFPRRKYRPSRGRPRTRTARWMPGRRSAA